MPIEDVFSIKGRGTVGTGRIERGVVTVGEEVEIVGLRETSKTTVTGVEMFNKILDSGQDVLSWNAPKELTEGHCRQAADALQRARDQYAAGIELIERALRAEGAAISRD